MDKKRKEGVKQEKQAESRNPSLRIGQIGEYKPIPRFNNHCKNC